MSVQLTLADLIVEAVKKPRGEEPSTAQDSSTTATDPNTGTSAGEKHFNRVGRGNSVSSTEDPQATEETSSSTQDTSSLDEYTLTDIANLLMLAAMNSSAALEDQSNILQMISQQAQANSVLAQTDQANLNTQLAEQAKKQKRMKILGWVVKSVAVVITVAMIAGSGGVLAAPLTTALMVGLTCLTMAAPDLLNNQIIGPLASVLEKAGVPPKWSETIALLVVFSAVLIATGGAGAADEEFAGKLASEASGSVVAQKMAGTAVEEGTLDYGTLKVSARILTMTQLMASTQLLTKILLLAFPDHPERDKLIGTILTIVIAVAGGIGGTKLLASSGYLENMLGENAEAALRKLTTALRLVMGGTDLAESATLAQEGTIADHISAIQSSMKELQSFIIVNNSLMGSEEAAMKQTNGTLESNSEAVKSLTILGETVLANTGS